MSSKKVKNEVNQIILELERRFGQQGFFTLKQLTEVGIFGNHTTARQAVKDKYLTSINVSPRRAVIPKNSLVEYLSKRIS